MQCRLHLPVISCKGVVVSTLLMQLFLFLKQVLFQLGVILHRLTRSTKSYEVETG
jgi:hypothetical protein